MQQHLYAFDCYMLVLKIRHSPFNLLFYSDFDKMLGLNLMQNADILERYCFHSEISEFMLHTICSLLVHN